MPRALSSQQAKVLTKRRYTIATRARVKDSTGTFQDLRAFLGRNWVARVTYGQDIDDQTGSATVELFRDKYAVSLAPLVETSKANLLTGSYAPLIDAMREIIIETAVLPEGVAVASGDWIEVFRGFIDRPAWGGKDKNTLTLDCRDLAAPLAEIVTEMEGRPSGAAYGLDPTGRPLEEVMQDVLDDWATPAGYSIVLYTPTGTLVDPRPVAERCGFNVKQFVPAKAQSVLDTLRILANFVGYDVKVRWSSVTNTHRLELFNPPRGNTTPNVTIGPSAIRDVQRLEIDPSSVRNVVVVTYQTDPADVNTKTSTAAASDSASITRYRRRWMEVASGASSGIDSATEAVQMRDAILADLKDPKAEMIVESSYRPDLILNDLVRWSPDGVHFTANQDLACVSLRHRIEPDGKAETLIATRGTPCGQFTKWLYVAAGPNTSEGKKTFPGKALTVALAATVGGITINVDGSNQVDRNILQFEYHVSTSSGFTPDRAAVSTTRVARGQMTRVEVLNLTPGTTYYVKVLVVRQDGVVSAASTQQATIPVRLGSTLLDKLDYLELKDMDGTPVADRRLRVIDGEIRAADTSNVEGQYIRGSSLKEGTGPLTKLSAAGLLDNITSIVARAITDLTGNLPGNRLTEGTGPLTNLSAAGLFNSLANITTKTLDLITDGVTYARVLAASLSAGKVNLAAGSAGLAGQLPEAQLGDLAVSAAKIQANAVTNAKILDGAVTNAKVDAAAGIVGTKLAGGAGVLTALETGTGRLVDPEIKDGTGAVHRKLKNVGGKFLVTDSSSVEQVAVWASAAKFEKPVYAGKQWVDGMPFGLTVDGPSTNHCKNPSFETNTAAWEGYASDVSGTVPTLSRDTTQYVFGGASLKVVNTDNAWTGFIGARMTTADAPAASETQKWSASCWVRLNSRLGVTMSVEFRDASSSLGEESVSVEPSANTWVPIRVSGATAPTGTTLVIVRVFVFTPNSVFDLWIDGVSLERASIASAYFDGSFGVERGCAWTGTAHASASTRDGGLANHGAMAANAPSLTLWEDGELEVGAIAPAHGTAALIGESTRPLRLSGAGAWFPLTPSTNDVFFRTDRGILYYYDGTRWLSVEEYVAPIPPYDRLPSSGWSATDDDGGGLLVCPEAPGSGQVYITNLVIDVFIGATNDATHRWQITLKDQPLTTTITTQDTGTPVNYAAGWNRIVKSVNSVRTSATDKHWNFGATKVNSPTSINLIGAVHYRLIG